MLLEALRSVLQTHDSLRSNPDIASPILVDARYVVSAEAIPLIVLRDRRGVTQIFRSGQPRVTKQCLGGREPPLAVGALERYGKLSGTKVAGPSGHARIDRMKPPPIETVECMPRARYSV